MTGTDTDARLRVLEARAEITELGYHYCLAMDEQDEARLHRTFAPDARVISQNGWLDSGVGIDAIVAMYRRFWETLGPCYHWMHGTLIEFDKNDPDRATGLVMGHAETYRKPLKDTYVIAMRYRDIYRRHQGTWRFQERNMSVLYFCTPGEYHTILGSKNRVTVRGKPEPADWPESLPTWKD